VIPGSTEVEHPVLPGPESLRAAELLRFRARYYRIPPAVLPGPPKKPQFSLFV